MRAELGKFANEEQTLHDQINAMQNAIFKGNEKLDQYNMEMTLNREELEQWALAAKQKEEDNQALMRYVSILLNRCL